MQKLSVSDLNRPDVQAYKEMKKLPIVLILDNLRSMYNVGAIFRTADAFLLEKIYLCGITATPPHKEIRKSALGAEQTVEWKYEKEASSVVNALKKEGYTLLAIEQVKDSIPLDHFQPEKGKKYALILGNEVKGVQQNLIDVCDASLEIPQSGTKHSLNVSVCAGVVLWPFYSALR